MSTEDEQPKVFWKSSVPDPDNIDLDELLNDRTDVNLDDQSKESPQKSTPSNSETNSPFKAPKPSPMKQSLEVNADMSKQDLMQIIESQKKELSYLQERVNQLEVEKD
jgi:hypothetical protein